MVLDVSAAVLEATIPFGHISDQQVLDQTLCVPTKNKNGECFKVSDALTCRNHEGT